MSAYDLYATLGSPKIDIMVMNMPRVKLITFEDDKNCQQKRDESIRNAKEEIHKIYNLFHMISPTYYIFNLFSGDGKSKSSELANSILCQRLDRELYQRQHWTNFKVKKNYYTKEQLLRTGMFRHDIAISNHNCAWSTFIINNTTSTNVTISLRS